MRVTLQLIANTYILGYLPSIMEPEEELMEEQQIAMEDCYPVMCEHCNLDLDLHDGSGFCPGGTEEAGGRR